MIDDKHRVNNILILIDCATAHGPPKKIFII